MHLLPETLPVVAVAAVARALRVPAAQMLRDTREQPATFARQVSWWLLHDVCGWPHPLIAQYAHRDRSAISHGITVVLDRITTEPSWQLLDRLSAARGLFLQAMEEA